MSITTTASALGPALLDAMEYPNIPHARRQAAEWLETARVQRWGPHETLASILEIEMTGRQAVSLQR